LCTDVNCGLQGLQIFVDESDLDVSHVDLGPGDDNPDQSSVPGAQTSHAVVEHIGEVAVRVGGELVDCQQRVPGAARESFPHHPIKWLQVIFIKTVKHSNQVSPAAQRQRFHKHSRVPLAIFS